ncbi:MAG: hypothetical protein JSS55_17960 [Proteobacteria bacterium]|nr:hypothetical protein [Pseudomonadota bacterium]
MISSITLDDALARGGPSAASFARLWRSLWDQPYLPNDLLELCRLTFARLHADKVEMESGNALAPGIASHQRQAVLADRALDDPALPDDWKSVLLFAEYYWIDTQSIPDDVADSVKAHHGEAGLVFLIEALGCLDGRIRTARCLRDLAAGGLANDR